MQGAKVANCYDNNKISCTFAQIFLTKQVIIPACFRSILVNK